MAIASAPPGGDGTTVDRDQLDAGDATCATSEFPAAARGDAHLAVRLDGSERLSSEKEAQRWICWGFSREKEDEAGSTIPGPSWNKGWFVSIWKLSFAQDS